MLMKVLIPTPLRQFAQKQAAVDLPAQTVGEALGMLTSRNPELRRHLFTEEGRLRSFVNLYLNDEDVRYLEKENTPVGENDVLAIVPSIAGGAGRSGRSVLPFVLLWQNDPLKR
jgi:molybdopterin converting factor small subunit